MIPALIGAAAAGAVNALLGNRANGFLLYFESFIPALDKRTFGIGRIIAAAFTFFVIIYGGAPFILFVMGAIVHADSFNFWTVTFSRLPKCISKKELHRSYLEMKLFNKFTNEAFWFSVLSLAVCGVSVLIGCNVALIELADKMSLVSFIILAIIWFAFMLGAAALVPITGKMNKYSEQFIRRMKIDRNKEIKRLGCSMVSLRIQIGNLFVLKMTTYMEIMNVVFDQTINVLLAFEEFTSK